MRYTKRNKRRIPATNAIEPAAPASVWGNGCSGKGGKTTNYDAELKDSEIRSMIYGRKAGTENA